MTNDSMFPSISAALQRRAEYASTIHECNAEVFRLKRDGSICDDAFDERRMSLYAQTKRAEDQIEVINAWIGEERRAESERERERKAAEAVVAAARKNETREQHKMTMAAAQKKNGATGERHLEAMRLALEIQKAKSERVVNADRIGRDRFRGATMYLVEGLLRMDEPYAVALVDRVRRDFPGLVEHVEAHGSPAALVSSVPV